MLVCHDELPVAPRAAHHEAAQEYAKCNLPDHLLGGTLGTARSIAVGVVARAPDGSRNFELHLSEVGSRDPLLNPQDLNSHNLILVVEIQHDAGPNLLGLNYPRIIQAQVEGIGLLVEVHSHSLPLCVRSKYAVTTSQGWTVSL